MVLWWNKKSQNDLSDSIWFQSVDKIIIEFFFSFYNLWCSCSFFFQIYNYNFFLFCLSSWSHYVNAVQWVCSTVLQCIHCCVIDFIEYFIANVRWHALWALRCYKKKNTIWFVVCMSTKVLSMEGMISKSGPIETLSFIGNSL